jgi:N-acetylneuraminic acid mutarotase
LLPNGNVLVAGGFNPSYLSSAEIYDSAAGTWSSTGSMTTSRAYHTGLLLPNNGKVLVAGGYGNIYNSSSELYDPSAGTWTATGSMSTARYASPASLLPSNGKVLIPAGHSGSGFINSAETYDP